MVKGNVAMNQKIQKREQENEGILTLAGRTENRAVTAYYWRTNDMRQNNPVWSEGNRWQACGLGHGSVQTTGNVWMEKRRQRGKHQSHSGGGRLILMQVLKLDFSTRLSTAPFSEREDTKLKKRKRHRIVRIVNQSSIGNKLCLCNFFWPRTVYLG